MIYSKSNGTVIYFVVNLFSDKTTPFVTGFSDRKNGKANAAGHENSKDRRDAMISWITSKSTANTIDRVLKTQYETERQYLLNILKLNV